jgi:hypothetical protein
MELGYITDLFLGQGRIRPYSGASLVDFNEEAFDGTWDDLDIGIRVRFKRDDTEPDQASHVEIDRIEWTPRSQADRLAELERRLDTLSGGE